MLGASKHTNQPAKSVLHARVRGRWRDVRDRRLLADHELQLGNQVDNQRAVWIQRLTQLLPPLIKLGVGLREKLANQALNGLSQGSVRNIALQLIEFARGEQAP